MFPRTFCIAHYATPLVRAQQIILLSQNPTVPKVTRTVDERKGETEEVRKSMRNGKKRQSLTSIENECKRRTEKSAPQAKEKSKCICTRP